MTGSKSGNLTVYNVIIKEAGLYFIGHFNLPEIKIFGTSFSVSFPLKDFNYNKFFEMFDIDAEDGKFLHEVEGKYARIYTDETRKIVGISHILDDDKYIMVE